MKNHPIGLFCVTIVVCAILEYFTSYIMEKLFHARWWDYSNMKFNINGRICLETIIPFGIAGLLIIYIINPFIFSQLSQIPENILIIISIVIATIFIVDCGISLKIILNVSSTTKKFDQENPKDNTEEISQKVRQFLRDKSFLNRRLIDAFPKLTAIIKANSEKIKQRTEEIKEDFNEKASEVKAEINEKTEKVKDGIQKTSKTVKTNIKIAKRKVKRMKNNKKGKKPKDGIVT